MNGDIRKEAWLQFRANHPKEIDWKDFYDLAKDPKSPFHEDLEWNQKRAADEYYKKRCLNLIIQYDRIYCNVTTSYQRLHATYSAKALEAGVRKRVAKTADEISKNDVELAHMRAAIWSRLRRVTGDMQEFVKYIPEFAEIYEFLLPRIGKEMSSVD